MDPEGYRGLIKSDISSTEKLVLLRQYFEETKIKERAMDKINESFNKAKQILNNIDFKKNYLLELNSFLKNRGN